MRNVSSRAVATSLAIIPSLVLFIAVSFLIDSWPSGFVRPGSTYVYGICYFGSMWIFILVIARTQLSWSIPRSILIGVVIGQLLSMAAVAISQQLAITGSVQQLETSSGQLGLSTLLFAWLTTTFLRSIVLGGWLFGILSTCMSHIMADSNAT